MNIVAIPPKQLRETRLALAQRLLELNSQKADRFEGLVDDIFEKADKGLPISSSQQEFIEFENSFQEKLATQADALLKRMEISFKKFGIKI